MPDLSDSVGALGVVVIVMFVLVGLLITAGIVTAIVMGVRRSATSQPADVPSGPQVRHDAMNASMIANQQAMHQQQQLIQQQQVQNDQLQQQIIQQQIQQQIIQNNINNGL